MSKAIHWTLAIYLMALPVSMGVMEMASWLTVLLFLIFLGQRAQQGSPLPLSLPLGFWALVALSVVAFASATLNQLPGDRYLDSVGKFRWIILYFFMHNIFTRVVEPKQVYKYALYAVPLVLLTVIYGIAQYYTGIEFLRSEEFYFPPAIKVGEVVHRWRTIGWFNLPFTYGYIYGGIGCLLLVHLYNLGSDKMRLKAFHFVTLVLLVISLILTYTRGVWLAVMVAYPVVLFLLNRRHATYASIAGAVGLALLLFIDTSLLERVTSIADSSHQSNSERLSMWWMNFEIFKDNPWFGVGFDENSYVIKEYYEKFNIVDVPASHAHNSYLNYLAGLGVFGLFSFLAFLFSQFKQSVKAVFNGMPWPYQQYAVAYLGILLILSIGGLTECNFKDAEVTHFFVFTSALFSSLVTRQKLKLS